MDSAIDIHTDQVVDGEELWYVNPVDKNGYVCRGCRVMVNPVSFEIHHKKRPHFKELLNHPHESWCNIEGEITLIAKANKERLTTQNGFPCSFPSKLELLDERKKVDGSNSMFDISHSVLKNNPVKTGNSENSTKWTARTIRPICRTYINFPYDRDLPLSVPGVFGKTYDTVIRKLAYQDIVKYPKNHIFFAPIKWSKDIIKLEDKIIIELFYGFRENGRLVEPYRVIVDITNWDTSKKNYVLKELEVSRSEAEERLRSGDYEENVFLFFLGEQNEKNFSEFIITDHRLICCLTGDILISKFPSRQFKKNKIT